MNNSEKIESAIRAIAKAKNMDPDKSYDDLANGFVELSKLMQKNPTKKTLLAWMESKGTVRIAGSRLASIIIDSLLREAIEDGY